VTARPRIWRHRTGEFPLGERTLLMGIVNITPDSFSDGGSFLDPAAAVAHAQQLIAEGADVLDLGAESTRPGSEPVPAAEQVRRLLPVLTSLCESTRIPLSVDTTQALVARAALEHGASIINDVSGFHDDRALPKVCAEYNAGVVLMHRPAPSRTMQQATDYSDLLSEIREYLQAGIGAAHVCSIERERILVDPGLGFGKTFDQNYALLRRLSAFTELAAGILVGPSRKAFTGELSAKPAPERQFGTAAAVALAALNGADVIRVHDVAQMKEVVEIIDRYKSVDGK
jgi:dihydropteroate synthase